MAYLKGNTYFDGDLYVNGSLKVKRVTDESGTHLPYVDNLGEISANTLAKFTSTDGGVFSTCIQESIDPANSVVKYNIKNITMDKDTNQPARIGIVNILNNGMSIAINNTSGLHIGTSASNIFVDSKQDNGNLIPLVKENTILKNQYGDFILIDNMPYKVVAKPGDFVFKKDTENKLINYLPVDSIKLPGNINYKITPDMFCYEEDLEILQE